MSVDFIDISEPAMEELLKRIESAQDDGLSLEPDDIRLVLQILRHFAFMQERLNNNDVMKQRYLKLLGLISSSESQEELFKGKGKEPRLKPPRTPKKPISPPSQVAPPTVCHHSLSGLEKGQACPKCAQGKVYKFEPASFVRITGSPPLQVEKHILEQLRCNLCGALFTASLPEDALNDGARGEKYAYSARAVMVINKFYMGSPYYRQESLQKLLGVPVTASTVYDQCGKVVDDVLPIFDQLFLLAATAVHFHGDDTGNRIIDQQPIEKPNRNGKGTRMRNGVYTSGLIATLADNTHIVLFQTTIGHTGEFIDEVLAQRDPALPAPLLMSDALSSNTPSKVTVQHSLCNSHARRKFTDILNNFPEETEYVVTQYATIWKNETKTVSGNLSPEARTAYHKDHSLPVMESLKNWAISMIEEGKVEENSGLGKAINYFIKHYGGLTLFCHVVGAKLDNNLMEMMLKIIALGRKNSYFFKTLEGAKVGDVLTSLIATCELNGINIFDYLIMVQRHRLSVYRQPERWLPWNYQSMIEGIESTNAA